MAGAAGNTFMRSFKGESRRVMIKLFDKKGLRVVAGFTGLPFKLPGVWIFFLVARGTIQWSACKLLDGKPCWPFYRRMASFAGSCCVFSGQREPSLIVVKRNIPAPCVRTMATFA